MELKKGLVVKMRLYKASNGVNEILRKANGEVTNDNQSISLSFATLEWENYMKQLAGSEWFRADVTQVLEPSKETGEYLTLAVTPKEVTESVSKALKGADKALSPVELKMQKMELELANLKQSSGKVVVDEDEADLKGEVSVLQKENQLLREQLESGEAKEVVKVEAKEAPKKVNKGGRPPKKK